ncbi:riboflavin synthase subunit beta [Formosa sediminum]|uniref:Riboflavin synthase subunit beta n=1 Tax=Formosa sediminum TaxID=2594004 RepID=A0A516GVK9_9FLAO|nr:riboflavin synthase subunit beta [Formosa sediminum]QDO95552.1 riboflavin synthase subunit beta [Formosa sediminum]
MGIFKTRQNKKFTYTPRHFKSEGDGSPFEIKHKFDDYRKTVGPTGGIKTKFKNAFGELKESPDRAANRRIKIIVAILILIFLFIIDFDLSIFLPNS